MSTWKERVTGITRGILREFCRGVASSFGGAFAAMAIALLTWCVVNMYHSRPGGQPEQQGSPVNLHDSRPVGGGPGDMRPSEEQPDHRILNVLDRIAADLARIAGEPNVIDEPPRIVAGPSVTVGADAVMIPVRVEGRGVDTQYSFDQTTRTEQHNAFDIEIPVTSFGGQDVKEVRITSRGKAGSDAKTLTIHRVSAWKPFHIDRWGGNVVWNKPKDLLGRRYYVGIADDLYLWTRDINPGEVDLIASDSAGVWKGRPSHSLKVGDFYTPTMNQDYRVRLVAISPAGQDWIFRPLAAWYEVDKRYYTYHIVASDVESPTSSSSQHDEADSHDEHADDDAADDEMAVAVTMGHG